MDRRTAGNRKAVETRTDFVTKFYPLDPVESLKRMMDMNLSHQIR